jgi:hypothetical protein
MLDRKRARRGERTTKSGKPFPKIPSDGLLNGAVCASYARCSKPNCKCARGSLHGPYYHRYQWHNGRVIKEYIPLSQVEEVRAACARYRQLQDQLREGRQHFKALLSNLRSTLRGLSYE